MQNEDKVYEIPVGEYDFLIKEVIDQDKNGYELKTQKGNTYRKLKIIIRDGNKNHFVYEPIFGSKNVKPILGSINNPNLTNAFNSEKFDLEDLIGEGGRLLLGHREYNGINYPQIECFIKPKSYYFQAPMVGLVGKDLPPLPNPTPEIQEFWRQRSNLPASYVVEKEVSKVVEIVSDDDVPF